MALAFVHPKTSVSSVVVNRVRTAFKASALRLVLQCSRVVAKRRTFVAPRDKNASEMSALNHAQRLESVAERPKYAAR